MRRRTSSRFASIYNRTNVFFSMLMDIFDSFLIILEQSHREISRFKKKLYKFFGEFQIVLLDIERSVYEYNSKSKYTYRILIFKLNHLFIVCKCTLTIFFLKKKKERKTELSEKKKYFESFETVSARFVTVNTVRGIRL